MRIKKYYELTKTRLLTITITKPRWKLLSLVLRFNENKPVKTAMKYLFIKPSASVKNLEAGIDQRQRYRKNKKTV